MIYRFIFPLALLFHGSIPASILGRELERCCLFYGVILGVNCCKPLLRLFTRFMCLSHYFPLFGFGDDLFHVWFGLVWLVVLWFVTFGCIRMME